jgi:hypothetical protein
MVVLGNMLKVVATIIVGYIIGLLSGVILGAVFGVFFSFFVPDFISSYQATLVSFFIALTLGSLLSSFASQVFNRMFETNINSFLGVIPGALFGLILVVFVYGYVDVSDPSGRYVHRTVNHFVLTPIMPYSAKIGGQIGAIVFPLFGAVGVIREIIQSHLQLQRNLELRKNSPPSNWGLPELPRKTPPIQAKPTTRPFLSWQSPMKSARERIFSFFLKAFGAACAIGAILSILGWQMLGWNSGAQFSRGFFLTGGLLAMFGYFNILGAYRGNRNIAARYGETAGEMDIHERTKHWATHAETSFTPFPNIFLISACLFGFSILISIIF